MVWRLAPRAMAVGQMKSPSQMRLSCIGLTCSPEGRPAAADRCSRAGAGRSANRLPTPRFRLCSHSWKQQTPARQQYSGGHGAAAAWAVNQQPLMGRVSPAPVTKARRNRGGLDRRRATLPCRLVVGVRQQKRSDHACTAEIPFV
jgi:hypothetical protein